MTTSGKRRTISRNGTVFLPLVILLVICGAQILAGAGARADTRAGTQSPSSDIYSNPDQEFGLLLVDDEGEPEGASLEAPLLASLIEIRVTGMVARARVTQMFSNPSDRRVEAVYVFPIPDQAAVDELRLRVGDREVIGEMREVAEAEAVYREAETDGRVATLLTKERDDVFTTRVTQIGPGEMVEVEIGLQFLVDFEDGAFRLRFPLVVAPRFAPAASGADHPSPYGSLLQPPVAGDVERLAAFHVRLEPGFPLDRLESASHEILVSKAAEGGSIVRLADEMVAAGRDFLLTWRPEPGTTPRTTVLVDEVDGERYALVMIIPPNVPNTADVRLPRETIFVIDTSGSMSGGKLAQARRAILMALDSFRPGDRLNVLRFSSEVTALFEAPRAVTEASLTKARDFVGALETDGGTYMEPALRQALLDVSRSEDLRQVIFVTDGRVTNEAELYQLVQEELGRSRIFTVGIGEAPNAAFMRRIATLGRGTFTFIDGHDVAGPMRTLLRTLDSPALRDVELTWNDPAVDVERDVLPARVPDLYLGRPLVVAARIGRATELHAAGWLRDRYLELTVPLASSGGSTEGTSGLDREWARRRVETLVLPAVGEGRSEREQDVVRQEITELGLRHHIMTPFTSLVGADVVRSAPRGQAPQRVVVPAPPVDVGLGAGDLVAETITVAAEAPMIDVTKVYSGLTVEKHGDAPWLSRTAQVALARTAGVQVDRSGLDRLDGGAPGAGLRVVSRAGSTTSTWEIDGLVIPELETAGRPPVYDSFESLEEMSTSHDIQAADDGVTLRLETARGRNELRTAAEFRAVGDSARETSRDPLSGRSIARDRVVADDYLTASLAGPLVTDRLWGRIAGEQRDSERAALGGEIGHHERWAGIGRLDLSLADKAALAARWNRGEREDSGLGAGPSRAPSSLLGLDSSVSTRSLDGSFLLTSNLFLTGLYGEVESEGSVEAQGGEWPRWDADGILRGDLGARRELLDRRHSQLAVTYFADLSGAAHELKVGARRIDDEQWLSRRGPGGDGILTIDGALFGGATQNFDLFEPSGSAVLDSRHQSLWLQDQAQLDRWTATVGLRWDEQRGRLSAGRSLAQSPLSWTTLSPRISLARFFGYERWTALRLMWGRFDESLASGVLTRTVPGLSGRALYGDDGSLLDGGGAVLPHRTDPRLDAAPTDELALWLEQQIGPYALVSLGLVHRRQRNVAETRRLIFDGDLLRPSTAGDYALDHVAAGVLPDGSPYSVPVYSLRPGLQDSGGRWLTNGSRDIEYEGVTLRFRKRFHWLWSASGHLHYGEARWRVGEAYAAGQDPTILLGAGDRDGDPVVVSPDPAGLDDGPWLRGSWAGGPWLGGRWSAELAGTVKLFRDGPWELFVTGELHAREGGPLPYHAWDTGSVDGGFRRIRVTRTVDEFRLDDVVTLDLQISKRIEGLGPQLTTLTLQILNLTDDDTALDRELLTSSPRAGWIEERVASRTVRLGVRFSWD